MGLDGLNRIGMRRAGRGGTLHAVWPSCELKISRYVWEEGFTREPVQYLHCRR